MLGITLGTPKTHLITPVQAVFVVQAERLEYFEMLMQACEQRGLNQTAAHFARAAVSELPTAFSHGNAQRIHCAGRLWANLLTFALDEDDFQVPFRQLSLNLRLSTKFSALSPAVCM